MLVEVILVLKALVTCEAGVILGARVPVSLAKLDLDHVTEHLVVRTGHHQLLLQLDLLDLG